MKKKFLLAGVCMMGAGMLLTSCSGDEKEGEDSGDSGKPQKEISKDDINEPEVELTDTEKVDYRLPTPNLFFEVIKKIGGDADMELVNSVENKDNYETTAQKALNFGVYISDLAYMMNYDFNSESAQYFGAIKSLADEMSISKVFSEDLMNKLSENTENGDSLYAYSSEIYYNAYTYLEEEKKEDVLSYMLIGGWVESMHIVTHLIDGYSDNNAIIDEIGAQKVIIESIMEHAQNSAEKNPELNPWLDDLGGLLEIYYEHLQEEEVEADQSNGKIILDGGEKVVLDAESFGTIVEKVEEMRAKIVDGQ